MGASRRPTRPSGKPPYACTLSHTTTCRSHCCSGDKRVQCPLRYLTPKDNKFSIINIKSRLDVHVCVLVYAPYIHVALEKNISLATAVLKHSVFVL